MHRDVKPENILFRHEPSRAGELPSNPDVVIIDFGGATWDSGHHSSIVCTRQYRPPEVRLEERHSRVEEALDWHRYNDDRWGLADVEVPQVIMTPSCR